MAKRKIDCTLDEFVSKYMKKANCDKSLKLFEDKVECKKNVATERLKQFFGYLKEKEVHKKKMIGDDLGFEINFEAFQPEKKVSAINISYTV